MTWSHAEVLRFSGSSKVRRHHKCNQKWWSTSKVSVATSPPQAANSVKVAPASAARSSSAKEYDFARMTAFVLHLQWVS